MCWSGLRPVSCLSIIRVVDCFLIDVHHSEAPPPGELPARHAVLTFVTDNEREGSWLLWHAAHPRARTPTGPYVIPGASDELDLAIRSAREFLHAYFGLDHGP